MSVGHGADPGFLTVSPQVILVTDPIVGFRYFPAGPRLLSQQKRSPLGLYQIILLGDRGIHACVSSLPNATTQWCPARTRTRDLCESQVGCPANSATAPSQVSKHARRLTRSKKLQCSAITVLKLPRKRFTFRALWRSVLSARVPECQKN